MSRANADKEVLDDQAESSHLALFEDGYFRRTLGPVISHADIALTELVANAWDAGATLVSIKIPDEAGRRIEISDDGEGMTDNQFSVRWRTLSYNRLRHQGPQVKFPKGVDRNPRRAYGRNGIGRHAMFCFCDSYIVATRRDGMEIRYEVTESAGDKPFDIKKLSNRKVPGHGTRIYGEVTRKLPDSAEMLEILAARFMYDPEFVVRVNGTSVELQDHSGLMRVREYNFFGGEIAQLYVLDAKETARTKFQHGIAFWVGKRLVGEPSWSIGGHTLLDGRTREAKRLTFIVKLDETFEDATPDWTGLLPSKRTKALYKQTTIQIESVLKDIFSSRAQQRTEEVIDARRDEVRSLDPLAQLEVAEFAGQIAENQPLASTELIIAAVDALIHIENSRSGQALIEKLANMKPDEIESLNRLLDDWSIRDALTVLEELGRRARVVEAIERLSGDRMIDELHTLHPLLAQARWVFGTEYDTPSYISNISLRNAVSAIAGTRVSSTQFENPRQRPDLIVLNDGTLSATAIEEENEAGLAQMRRILLIELKKGGSTIGRTEMQQAEAYVEELMASSDIDGRPRIDAYVVGDSLHERQSSPRKMVDGGKDRGFIFACTYKQLVRTANRRLFFLRSRIETRYPDTADSDLIRAITAQKGLFDG